MSPHELFVRTRYGAFCAVERPFVRHSSAGETDRLRRALRADLRRDPDWKARLAGRRHEALTRFFPAAAERQQTRDLFDSVYRRNAAIALAQAADVLAGRISFFGRTFQYDAAIPWHADPVTGAEWPRVYHRDVLAAARGRCGDVKYVWELNRHQFLIDLAKAWFLTGDARYSARLFDLVDNWIAENPYGIGVSWACALEPAFRSFSWLWAYHLCADAAIDDRQHLTWLSSFHDHGRFIYRHLEHYASPYNHLIGEAAALYMLGVLFPEFAEAPAWRRRGRRVLEEEVGRQFYADGGSVEQSPFYHHATLGFYLLAACLGRLNGEEFDPTVWSAIERAIEFSMHLQQPDGTTPRIGGADDGKPLRMEHRPLWDFRFVQSAGAALFGRGDFRAAAGEFAEDAFWLLGQSARAEFERLPAIEPSASAALNGSGYYILRSAWGPRADYVCVDCGEQAGGLRRDDVPSAAHGHADCLSVVVWLGGKPVLVDPGLFSYNGPREWVEHFRRTGAHNTLRVDGLDQAEYVGKMAWARTYAPRLERYEDVDGCLQVTGSHDGYARVGVVHRRTVSLRNGGYVVIADEILCSGTHDIELQFQFAPGRARLEGPDKLVFDNAEMAWSSPVALRPVLAQGGPSPQDGWIAESLGVTTPAPRLSLMGTVSGPGAVILTVIADAAAEAPRVDRRGAALRVAMRSSDGNGRRELVRARDVADATAGRGEPITTEIDQVGRATRATDESMKVLQCH